MQIPCSIGWKRIMLFFSIDVFDVESCEIADDLALYNLLIYLRFMI